MQYSQSAFLNVLDELELVLSLIKASVFTVSIVEDTGLRRGLEAVLGLAEQNLESSLLVLGASETRDLLSAVLA